MNPADHSVDHHDEHHRGLAFDVGTIVARRRALQLMGGAGLLALIGCGSSGSDAAPTTSTAAAGAGASTTAPAGGSSSAPRDAIPAETAGPFPGNGSNGPDALSQSGIVRRDITTSFGGSSGTAGGVPLAISLVVTDAATGNARRGAAVYAWHCDREGRYSMYSSGVEDQDYLRGVQETGSDGTATFESIFPGCYAGRWPHVHFEVYESVDAATGGGTPIATSQLALPSVTSGEVYAESGYEQSLTNFAGVSLETDMVFADSYRSEMGTISGSVADGLAVSLPVPV